MRGKAESGLGMWCATDDSNAIRGAPPCIRYVVHNARRGAHRRPSRSRPCRTACSCPTDGRETRRARASLALASLRNRARVLYVVPDGWAREARSGVTLETRPAVARRGVCRVRRSCGDERPDSNPALGGGSAGHRAARAARRQGRQGPLALGESVGGRSRRDCRATAANGSWRRRANVSLWRRVNVSARGLTASSGRAAEGWAAIGAAA